MKKEATITDVHELLMHVVEHMATKEDTDDIRVEMTEGFVAIREEMATKKDLASGLESVRVEMSAGFASIRSEISEIKTQLKDLEEAVTGHSGFAKEIDHALTRIAVIERHLGLQAS